MQKESKRKIVALLLCMTLFASLLAVPAMADGGNNPAPANPYAAYVAAREAYFQRMTEQQRRFEQEATARVNQFYLKMLLRYAIVFVGQEAQRETFVEYAAAMDATMLAKYRELVAAYETAKQKALAAQAALEAAQRQGAANAQAAIDAASAAWSSGTMSGAEAIQRAVAGHQAATAEAQVEIGEAVEEHADALSEYGETVGELDEEYRERMRRIREEYERRLREQQALMEAALARLNAA